MSKDFLIVITIRIIYRKNFSRYVLGWISCKKSSWSICNYTDDVNFFSVKTTMNFLKNFWRRKTNVNRKITSICLPWSFFAGDRNKSQEANEFSSFFAIVYLSTVVCRRFIKELTTPYTLLTHLNWIEARALVHSCSVVVARGV